MRAMPFSGFQVEAALVLLLCSLPLLAAVTVVGCSSIGFLVYPQRTVAIWSYRVWLAGISTLAIALPFLSFVILKAEIGYVGMLFGYG